MKFSKHVVVAIVVLNILFASAVLAVFWHTGNEPVALVGAWFGFTTGELWLLSGIKKKKIGGADARCESVTSESETTSTCSGGEVQGPGY